MNSRGLMELIIINIGLQKGVIQPALFAIMVLMAIITTLMASPMFEWVYGRHARKAGMLGGHRCRTGIGTRLLAGTMQKETGGNGENRGFEALCEQWCHKQRLTI